MHLTDMPEKRLRIPEIEGDPPSHSIGAHALLAATLERAIRDAVPLGYVERHHIRESRQWFKSGKLSPFSFLWICEALMICPEFVIHSVYQLRKSQRSLRHYRMGR